ncbi:bile acid:sodium symporter family protein [Streptomyces sp. NPDC059474]|uniref:bile acid:sodium symporter family protein n=1 Tax=Streptomyces sp. NPDC059474 TaxID=3346846 RepID=UPI00367D48D2
MRSESKSSAADPSTTAAQAPSPSPSPESTSADRAARRAVTVFPILVLAAGAAGLTTPGTFSGWAPNVPYLLGVIMFCMGLTMTPQDFSGVVKRPWAVALGLVAHYVIMPGLGWLIANALGLSPQLAAGVILVGCAPSGTASNVVTYLARGDVALSVSVATVSTVLAPLVTPPLTLLLAGEFLPVDAGSMVTDILKTTAAGPSGPGPATKVPWPPAGSSRSRAREEDGGSAEVRVDLGPCCCRWSGAWSYGWSPGGTSTGCWGCCPGCPPSPSA